MWGLWTRVCCSRGDCEFFVAGAFGVGVEEREERWQADWMRMKRSLKKGYAYGFIPGFSSVNEGHDLARIGRWIVSRGCTGRKGMMRWLNRVYLHRCQVVG